MTNIAKMEFRIERHGGKEMTGEEMNSLVKDCFSDLGPSLGDSLQDWFEKVKNIPYIDDFELFGIDGKGPIQEILSRPMYLMNGAIFPSMDCKKKAILIAAWAEGNNVPWRFVAVREEGFSRFHHVFPQLKIAGEWYNCDATMPHYKLFAGKPLVREAAII